MIPEVNPYNNYKGDGVATKFDFDFYIQNPNQLIVEKISSNNVVTPLVNEVDYTIKQFEGEIGGYIEYPINSSMHEVLQDDETISLQLNLAFEQQSEYGQSSLLDLNSIEFSLDYLTRLCQILKRKLELCVKVEEGSNISPDELFESINVSKEECILNAQAANTSAINAAIEANESKANADKSKQYANNAEELNASLTENFEDYQEELRSEKEGYKEEINIAKNSAIAEVNSSGLASRANLDLSNLSTQGQAKFDAKANKADVLTKSQITNTILEIPQKINYTLSDGTLTLKAGSKVIVPNGANKFDEVTVSQDITVNTNNSDTNVLCIRNGNASISRRLKNQVGSGATTPTTSFWLYYNTNDNIVYDIREGVAQDYGLLSFPVLIYTSDDSGVVSVDEVFNGFGYIGNTIFCDKGIKGLIPNGRNEDGSLNNIEFTTSSVLTQTRNISGTNAPLVLRVDNFSNYGVANYDEDLNLNISSVGTNVARAIVGTWSANSTGRITEFKPNNTFHAVDYNDALLKTDKAEITSWGFPSSKTMTLNLEFETIEDDLYNNYAAEITAPSDGWFWVLWQCNGVEDYVQVLNKRKLYRYQTPGNPAIGFYGFVLPFAKGDVCRILYTTPPISLRVDFIYAEGAE